MKTVHHALPAATPGQRHELVSLHYGEPGRGPKAAIQASLHADETPAMLVAHHLRARLAALEAQGRLLGEVVLVPLANPIGLGQRLLHGHPGRFDLGTGENFNRHYANLLDDVARRVEGRLGSDAAANVATVRAALREAAAALPAATPLAGLRRTLLGLAIDADLVLDLHCDNDALMHLYTATPVWPRVEPLARLLGARAVLLATESGDDPFDEACSMVWPRLAARLGAGVPLPPSCVAITVELRGEADVDHALAAADAQALLQWLEIEGVIAPRPDGAPVLPAPACEATPLSGCMPVVAPFGGVVVYRQPLGAALQAGDAVADLVDPLTGEQRTLASPVAGVLFAREHRRFVPAGDSVCKIAGREARRSGKLLSD
jgi:hypothetical protein